MSHAKRFHKNITLNLSKKLLLIQYIFYAVLTTGFVYSNINQFVTLFFICIGMLSFYVIYGQQLKFQRLECSEDNQWAVYDKRGQKHDVVVQSGSYCSAGLVILNLMKTKKEKNNAFSLMIFKDVVSERDFLDLKILLLQR